MNLLLKILSFAGLGLTIMPSVLVFLQHLSMEDHKFLMLPGMVLWFVTAPVWMKDKKL